MDSIKFLFYFIPRLKCPKALLLLLFFTTYIFFYTNFSQNKKDHQLNSAYSKIKKRRFPVLLLVIMLASRAIH